ncbi:hypothetical protein OESDEN_06695 [Oesophagostomum dentatum]|uniref:Uncharacterized protein n=1 Tax=Oesophagostomum dentatum TaxID=61180 RepID=A0A0B1T749_OESDE|nr:hypothetical protein OESDEN_06695 [Oesophagostomum dentatum]
MSPTDAEDFNNFYDENFRLSRGRWRKHGKAVRDDMFITKTLCDLENALSRRCKDRLNTDRSDGLCPNVPYSLNKRNRWNKITAASLLEAQPENFPEALVVNRTDVPLNGESSVYNGGVTARNNWKQGSPNKSTITSVNVMEDSVMKTLSTGGRRKPLSYFNKEIRYLRDMDKKEIEPGRIHYNITVVDPTAHPANKKSRRTNKRCTAVEADFSEYVDREPIIEEVNEDAEEYAGSDTEKNFRRLTLGDYINLPENVPRHTHSQTDSQASEGYHLTKGTSLTPSTLVDISDATKASHTFEVIETNVTGKAAPFDLEQILSTVPTRFIISRFGPERVSITSPSYTKPMFVVFFEELKDRGILRVRINTNSQYPLEESRDDLVELIENTREHGFTTLFAELLEFITSPERKEPGEPEKNARTFRLSRNFSADVNSTITAPLAIHSTVEDQLAYLNEYYIKDGSEASTAEPSGETSYPTVCSTCRSPEKTDMFASTKGMMCRECVADFMMRQLRLRNFPLEIPVIVPSGASPLELLSAVLPMPVMHFLIKHDHLCHLLIYSLPTLVDVPKQQNNIK